MKNSLLILGNGFDLDLGLHTRFSEFWESDRWSQAKLSCPEKYLVKSLEQYRASHHWFDLESGLREGAERLIENLSKNYVADEYYNSFQLLKDELKEYVKEQQKSFVPATNSVAELILHAVDSSQSLQCIYTFNYTDIWEINERFHISSFPSVYHVHGSLSPEDDIILGIEVEDFTRIPPPLTFLIKSNSPYYHYTNLLTDLEMANHVIFFGHSINGMDFPYFKEYFQNLIHSHVALKDKKRITIITYDEHSAMVIKDNFRKNGIDVRSLFNKVYLEFIHTKSIYDGNEVEKGKLKNLERLLTMVG